MIIHRFKLTLCLILFFFATGSLSAEERDQVFWGMQVDRNTHAVAFRFGTPKKDVLPLEYDIVIVNVDKEISEIIAGPYFDLLALEGGVNSYPKELQVSNEQKERVEIAAAEAMGQLTELGTLLQKKEISDREAKKKAKDFAERVRGMKSDLFLDFQIERIEQVQFSLLLHLDGLLRGFESRLIRDRFSITDDQLRAMKKKKPRLEEDFEKEVYALREKYRTRMLENLTAEQRKKLKEIGGEFPARTGWLEDLMQSFKWDLLDY